MCSTWRPSCWATTAANGRPSKIQAALASKKTVEAKFVKPVPVYIVYFSSAALNGGQIVNYQDLYGRDAKVMAALLETKGRAPATQTAARR